MLFFSSCIVLLLFTLSVEAISSKSSTIIALGIDLSHRLETNRSTVRVAASLINESSSLTEEIVAVSDFSALSLPGIDDSDCSQSGNKNQWHLFQEAYQYENAQCANQTTGFSFTNNDSYTMEGKLASLFKRIKYMVSINYGFPKGKYFAVIAESKYNQDFRSLAKAAAKRAGFAGIIVMGRNVASTMICPDNNIESDHVYLELHLKKNSLDIAIMLKDEDGIFETLANQRLNYTASGLGILSMLSSTLDELARNAEIPDNTIVHQVIITSANPLTVSHHQAVQHLQAFLKSHLKSSNLVFCEGHATDDDNTIPYEYRIAFGAAKYSSLIAREQLEGGHFICCVELSPVHYGIAVAGGMMHPIIRRHSIEDGPKSAVFTTILPQKQQKSIEIAVYRGMRLQTAFNAHVGSLHVQNDGSLSLLNITIQVNHHSDELILTVQDLTTESIASLTFVNDKQTIAAEVEQFEKTWGPEQFDLSRTLDQQLKDNVDLVVSMYAVTANDTLQETLFKKLRYMFLARWKREQITDLLSRSDSRLIPNNREKGTFLAIDLN